MRMYAYECTVVHSKRGLSSRSWRSLSWRSLKNDREKERAVSQRLSGRFSTEWKRRQGPLTGQGESTLGISARETRAPFWERVARRKELGACVLCVHVLSHSVLSNCLQPHRLESARLLCPGILQARILEWVAVPFSRGSSWPRDWTLVSWISGGFYTIWAWICE